MSSNSLQIQDLFNVAGVVAVVTGGGSGIGLMIATALENNGAIVYILGRREDVLKKAAAENNKHGNIRTVVCDVTSQEDVEHAVRTIEKEVGHVNVLVNNSGVSLGMYKHVEDEKEDIKTFQRRLLNTQTPETFAKTFEVNVSAVYFTTVAFLELLHKGNLNRKSHDDPTSQVIIMSSIGGFRTDAGLSSFSYSASKAAVTHLGKLFTNKFKKWDIRSNIVAPGLYPSELTLGSLIIPGKEPGPEVVPLRRFGQTEDIGGLALFLASKAGAYISGGVHVTDGGRLGLFSSTF